MGNNKYYTPTLDQFVIGFQYEEKNNGKWFKRTCKVNNPFKGKEFIFDMMKNDFRAIKDDVIY
jgi:hypothetical protein